MVERIARLAVALFLVCAAGCYSYTMSTNARTTGKVHETRGPIFAWGLVGQEEHAPECGDDGVARASTYMPWWGGIVQYLTFGIVVPWRGEYECAAR